MKITEYNQYKDHTVWNISICITSDAIQGLREGLSSSEYDSIINTIKSTEGLILDHVNEVIMIKDKKSGNNIVCNIFKEGKRECVVNIVAVIENSKVITIDKGRVK